MRYVKKAAQEEIFEYYQYCIMKKKRWEAEGNDKMADFWDGKKCCIEKIYEIVKKHGYTKY